MRRVKDAGRRVTSFANTAGRYVTYRIGRRGFVLIMLGWVFFGSFVQMINPEDVPGEVQRQGSRVLMMMLPGPVWTMIMAVGVILCWLGCWFKRIEPHAFFFAAWLWTTFGVGYAIAIFGSSHPVAIFRFAITNFVVAGFVVIASTWKEH